MSESLIYHCHGPFGRQRYAGMRIYVVVRQVEMIWFVSEMGLEYTVSRMIHPKSPFNRHDSIKLRGIEDRKRNTLTTIIL